ncbi:hypothetical protein V8C86DRAFT_2499451 [Haematococcus lacustris]
MAQASVAGPTGFAQFALGITLMAIGAAHFRTAGPSSCIYDAAQVQGDRDVCSGLSWLALLSITSSLIIVVAQGVLGLLVGFPPRALELLARSALAVMWTATACVTTIATVQANSRDHSPGRTHWRIVAMALAWALAGLAWVMSACAAVALGCPPHPPLHGPGAEEGCREGCCCRPTGLLCQLLSLCCCCCCCSPNAVGLCAELLCLSWLWQWATQSRDQGGEGAQGQYHPIGPPPPHCQHECLPHIHPSPQYLPPHQTPHPHPGSGLWPPHTSNSPPAAEYYAGQLQPGAQYAPSAPPHPGSMYPPIPPGGPPPGGYPLPGSHRVFLAPSYSPFAQGPAASASTGWGLPAMGAPVPPGYPYPAAGPAAAAGEGPAPDPRPSASAAGPPPTLYATVGGQGGEEGQAGDRASGSAFAAMTRAVGGEGKEGYEPPSAPPS